MRVLILIIEPVALASFSFSLFSSLCAIINICSVGEFGENTERERVSERARPKRKGVRECVALERNRKCAQTGKERGGPRAGQARSEATSVPLSDGVLFFALSLSRSALLALQTSHCVRHVRTSKQKMMMMMGTERVESTCNAAAAAVPAPLLHPIINSSRTR